MSEPVTNSHDVSPEDLSKMFDNATIAELEQILRRAEAEVGALQDELRERRAADYERQKECCPEHITADQLMDPDAKGSWHDLIEFLEQILRARREQDGFEADN